MIELKSELERNEVLIIKLLMVGSHKILFFSSQLPMKLHLNKEKHFVANITMDRSCRPTAPLV